MSSIRQAGGISMLKSVKQDDYSRSPSAVPTENGAGEDEVEDNLAAALKAALSRRNNAITGADSDEEDTDSDWDD